MPAMTERNTPPEVTTPSRQVIGTSTVRSETVDVPWHISRALSGEGDLHTDLAQRYPNQPLMSLFSTRTIEGRSPRAIASLAAQDGSASLHVEIDPNSRALQCAYTLGSMLTLRFDLAHLSELDCVGWVEQMRQGQDRPTLLWGKQRWRADYLIWSVREHYTNLYAFSPLHIEAAARLTPTLTKRLVLWMTEHWHIGQATERGTTEAGW
jgi:hypothetical protein